MRHPHAVARLISTAAVVTSFWSHALGTDVTLRLVDPNRVPIPASVFVISGTPVAQNGVIALSEGTHRVTVFPGKVGGAEIPELYCIATLRILGAAQTVELVWRTSPAPAKVPGPPSRSSREADHAGDASGQAPVPVCALITEGHFSLTVADDGSWTYHPGRPTGATTPSDRADPAVVELAGQIAGITRVLASPGTLDSFHGEEEWVDSALAALGAEAQVFLARARLLKRDDPELLARFASLQTRLRQASLSMSWPNGRGTPWSANAARRDLVAHRLSAVEHLLEQMEKLLAPR